ncbi:MAG TPA: efflux RND transporter periplasmic adaptor subunit [Gammaproteobacteria bacterium]|nr:efflux RND transporter periplasmic adaptor subunit [Gammaproteobacteria bacterium]
MKKFPINMRSMTLALVLLPLLLAFGYVATSSGPLSPVPVTVSQVQQQAIAPALFGIGVVEARYRYRIGPSMTGRVLRLDVHVGDRVSAGQVLGEMDPVDMDNKIASSDAAIKRANASVVAAEARVKDSAARAEYARAQSSRYERLAREKSVSKDAAEAKYQEYQVSKASLEAAKANLNATRKELDMLWADYNGLLQQRRNLRLVAPVDGLVVGRYIEPGSTVVAGQPVLEIIDPKSIWVNVRFNQLQSGGLAQGLDASIVLRSRSNQSLSGRVDRVEPLADAVTEETLAKVLFERLPEPLPPIGELAEVTVSLPRLPATPVIPNASIKLLQGQAGVWVVEDNGLRFVPIRVGTYDLDGRVQILDGLKAGDQVVVYSKQELSRRSRIKIVDQLLGEAK